MDNEIKKNSNNPLHGITLEKIITTLQEAYGWEKLSEKLNVNCFKKEQSVKSCLTFFRKTPWARTKLENIYIKHMRR